MMNNTDDFTPIARQRIADRMQATHDLFGLHFPLRLEPTVFDMAGMLSAQYQGGLWEFYALGNGGFYMAPCTDEQNPDLGVTSENGFAVTNANCFTVTSENGFEGTMSGDALGITACLYAYSHLSFTQNSLGEICAEHYHWLREYALDHKEARAIFAAID